MEKARIVGTRIKRHRELASLSKSELARSVGVSPTAVHNWEENGVMPRMEVVLKLQKVFEVSWMQLISAFPDADAEPGPIWQVKREDGDDMNRGQRLERLKCEIAALFEVEPARIEIVIKT